MAATERFVEVVSRPEAVIPLDLAMLLVATHARPDIDVVAELARLDALAARCSEPTREALCHLLFEEVGLAGNREDYQDPRNSYLPDVLDRRLGIPISLSVIAMEVGRRAGVPLRGIGLPGHFVVRDERDPEVFVDCFNGGTLLDARACEARYRRSHRDEEFDAAWLEPVGARAIIARVLANLVAGFARRRDRRSLAWAMRLRAEVPGVDPKERHRLASVLAAGGRFDEAAEQLDRLAAVATAAGDVSTATEARHGATRLRGRLN